MTEHAYDERATNFSTTNHTLFDTSTDSLIGGLECDVVGTGAEVLVEFYAPAMGSTTNAIVTSYLVVNGAVAPGSSQYKNWATAQGEGGSMRRRLVLANGVAYNFKVGLSAGSGISTACGQAGTAPGPQAGVMFLRVTD